MLRIGGFALILAAVIQAAATVFDADLTTNQNAIGSPAWIPSHLGFSVAYTLVLLGLVSLYLRQSDRLKGLDEAGFVLAMIGSALTVSVSMLVGAALPVIAPNTPGLTRSLAFFSPGQPFHFMRPAVALTALTYFPGFILTGLAIARAAVMPKWAAWCLVFGALGTLGALAGPGLIGRIVTIAGSVLLAVAFTRLGYDLVTTPVNG